MKEENETEVNQVVVSRARTPSRNDLQAALDTLKAALETGMIDERPVEIKMTSPLIGPAAAVTGHGLAGGGRKHTGPAAWESFVNSLKSKLGPEVWERVSFEEQSAFVKIQALGSKERLYIAKTVTVVSRVECTLHPDLVPGSMAPDRPNGSILSWIPADEGSVTEAIKVLATLSSDRA